MILALLKDDFFHKIWRMPVTKVLIAEDSETQRNQLRDILENEGYEVIVTEDGEAGLNAYKQHTDVSLIISDYHMPKLDGLGFMTAVKKDLPEGRDLPCLMLTTESSAEFKRKTVHLGLKGVVLKPIDANTFLSCVKMILVSSEQRKFPGK